MATAEGQAEAEAAALRATVVELTPEELQRERHAAILARKTPLPDGRAVVIRRPAVDGPGVVAPGLRVQLQELGESAAADLQRGIVQNQVASGILFAVLGVGWLGGLASLLELFQWWRQGLRGPELQPPIELVVPVVLLTLVTPALIAYVGYLAASARRFAEWTYSQTARGLKHADYGLLFCDEGLAYELRGIQDASWVQNLVPEQHPQTLAQRLELAAENFPAAMLLPGAEDKVRAQLLSRRARRQRRFFFTPPPWLWLSLFIPPLGVPLAVIGASTYTFLGHAWIASRARLLAFCEWSLDQCRLSDSLNTAPPEEPQTWREKLLTPWRADPATRIDLVQRYCSLSDSARHVTQL